VNYKENGFTLIEVMIVIAIIGLLAAFVAPNFGFRALRSQIAGAVSELQSSLAMARSVAVTNGNQSIVKAKDGGTDFLNTEWQVISKDNAGKEIVVGVFSAPKGLKAFNMVNGGPSNNIIFLGDGRRDTKATGEFCIEGERDGRSIVRKVVISGAGQVIVSAPASCP
jgi:prepilin-type N-terminal cleavage/methylation domain-containing protein